MSSNKKIPYDVAPISRDYSSPANRRTTTSRARFSSSLFIIAILIFNIFLGVITITSIAKNNNKNYLNITNNIYVTGADARVAASKAKLSSVCVAVDSNGTYSSANLPNKTQMFSRMTSYGAGTIYSLDKDSGTAYIVTCNHVISGAKNNAFVILYDSDNPVYASFVGASVDYDVAVLKVQDDSLKTTSCSAATIGDSAYLVEGDMAIAIGNPQHKGFNVSAGVVSKTLVSYTSNSGDKIGIQIDTPVNSGNSGGGLFNKEGNFIGIVQSKIEDSKIDNIAYAIPSNIAISIAKNLIAGRNLSYAQIGYTFSLSTVVKVVDGIDYRFSKVVVASVTGAEQIAAGLHVGDTILSATYHSDEHKEFVSAISYDEIKFDLSVGDTLEYKVLRNNEIVTIKVHVSTMSTSG